MVSSHSRNANEISLTIEVKARKQKTLGLATFERYLDVGRFDAYKLPRKNGMQVSLELNKLHTNVYRIWLKREKAIHRH